LQVNLRLPRVGGIPVHPAVFRHSDFACLRPLTTPPDRD
jgi:hypothetical protein